MNNKIKVILIITIIIFVLGGIGTYFVFKPSERRMVEIVQDGTVLYTFDLETAENMDYEIISENGSKNIVTITDGEICISYAECPDHTCVKMGNLYSENLPIVCLPNKLIIRFC
ncbi:MAG: NusG domain II-containing protein [Hominimerdicola sp.]